MLVFRNTVNTRKAAEGGGSSTEIRFSSLETVAKMMQVLTRGHCTSTSDLVKAIQNRGGL